MKQDAILADPLALTRTFRLGPSEFRHVDLAALGESGLADPDRLPYCLRVLLENVCRNRARLGISADDVARLGHWGRDSAPFSLPTAVTRIILPDSSGLPALLDLAALRSALVRDGGDPASAEPRIPVHLVVDHSLIVDEAAHEGAVRLNMGLEFRRNAERYAFLKWAQQAFRSLRVVPPGMGIVHQVHIERIARVVATESRDGATWAFPEFVLGGDSHTPMVNGLGVLGWGVGGIEIEYALLGQPHMTRVAGVVGVRLEGRLRPGVGSTDLVLSLTERLREHGVIGRFIEFFGAGVRGLPVSDRTTIANMAPEYGATTGYFPIDEATLDYLRLTGREEPHVEFVEEAAKAIGIFRDARAPDPTYSEVIDFDLGAVGTSLAGPRRPQDRVDLSGAAQQFKTALERSVAEAGFGAAALPSTGEGGETDRPPLRHGAIAIAAITSCTNTSNPAAMVGAGLLARRAAERGLNPPAWVKTSLAPGSRVVARYLEKAGLLTPLEQLGFHVVGYGCTTCSGKSGEIDPSIAAAVERDGLIAAAVLSGNRNFEGRIHPLVRAGYLMSPMLVVAYALAGFVDLDLTAEPIGIGSDGRPVRLEEIWPDPGEIMQAAVAAHNPELYRANYAELFEGTDHWAALPAQAGPLFSWNRDSTYLVEPPFFTHDRLGRAALPDRLVEARPLVVLGDSVTTDHICPAGQIAPDSAAGRYLASRGVAPSDFNAYTQRRGNHEVMVRAIFASRRIRNLLAPDLPPGTTLLLPEERGLPVHEAAAAYAARGTPMIVIAGRDYGMGSSRDWAAKGPALLGVRAVIAESFERIHRSNLVALGIIPLRFAGGENVRTLGLSGREGFSLTGLRDAVASGSPVRVTAVGDEGAKTEFSVVAEIESQAEAECLAAGGMFAQIHATVRGKQARPEGSAAAPEPARAG